MTRYLATINTPGYLSIADPAPFSTAQEAWAYLAEERERAEDEFPGWPTIDGHPDSPEITEYTETLAILRRLGDANEPMPYAQIAEDFEVCVNENGCGAVFGDTPGCFSEHDLGLAYSVTEDELTDAEFDRRLIEKIRTTGAEELIMVPGIYEALAEYFNDDIYDEWSDGQ